MPIVTATQVTQFTNISANTSEVIASGLIPVVQERVNWITGNWFTTDLFLQSPVTFDGSARTIVSASSFAAEGFADGDEIYVYRSYRNDGYYTVASVATVTLTLEAGSVIVPELSNRSVLISVVQWPGDLIYTAAQMVAYDYDSRSERAPGVTSVRLGPWAESYSEPGSGEFGYPKDILAPLYDHRIVRLM
jgi:hypothetical protein